MGAIGLNLGPDMKGDTIQEIATHLRKVLLNTKALML